MLFSRSKVHNDIIVQHLNNLADISRVYLKKYNYLYLTTYIKYISYLKELHIFLLIICILYHIDIY